MGIGRKIQQAIDVLVNASTWPYLIRAGKPSLASYQICKAVNSLVPVPASIIDVGANQGQFAGAAAWWFRNCRIISFEPSPSVFPILERNLAGVPNICLVQSALGDSEGQLEFFESEYSHASSALQVAAAQMELKPDAGKVRKISVPVTKLDLFFAAEELPRPLLLKLDVQGFEKKVLEGGLDFLERVDYLLFECSYQALYEGEPVFDEMFRFVGSLGFELVAPVGSLENNHHVLLQTDLLWRRRK